MAYYLSKYKGKYKLRTEYDEDNNCFYRDSDGVLLDDEVYIHCKRGRISHYGGSILTAYVEPCDNSYKTNKYKDVYIDSLKTRTDERKEYVDDKCIIEKPYKKVMVLTGYGDIFNRLIRKYKNKIEPNSILKSDIGGSFRFNAKYLEDIAEEMGVYTQGRNMSPFSKNNLKKEKYTIPEKDNNKMKKVTKPLLDSDKIYLITKAYKNFGKLKNIDVEMLAQEHRLKPKEVLHKLGYFDDFVDFLSKLEY